ncbi:MAG: Group II intron-encoded protein LtrA [Syntrophorhabdaceae bacterium PtaU1.Bin034]|jgi:retron-type reverse transcriptase|nr:MAG: Group II intron-encoded protein LtrA [Syntrophorhabdaceae bacterium PtaU1.Bin034]
MDASKSLLDRFLNTDNFLAAYSRIRTKGASGGIDHVTLETFDQRLDRNINDLISEIRSGSYCPSPVSSVYIPKFNEEREWRRLGLPTIRDKVAQMACLQVVEPMAERLFLNTSYSYRRGKERHKALARVEHNLKYGKMEWAALTDIDNSFDNVSHSWPPSSSSYWI